MLLVFALLVAGLLFQHLVTLLVATLITVLVAIPLSAAADWLERRGTPRWLGALLALLAALAVLAGIVALVVPPLVDEGGTFVEQVPAIVEDLEQRLANGGNGDAGVRVQQFLERFGDPASLLGSLASLGLTIAGVIAGILLILATAYYIAVRPQPLVDGILSLFPPRRREWAHGLADRLRTAWIGWMQGVLVDMAITGVLLYVGLTLIGLEFAALFAALSAILVVIPYFGSIVGAIPPVAFALTISPEQALLALAIYVAVQQLESNITIPLVMASRAKLHPAVVAIGVVVIGELFGFIGLFVAVPILSAIVILVDELWVKPLEQRPRPAAAGPDVEARAGPRAGP